MNSAASTQEAGPAHLAVITLTWCEQNHLQLSVTKALIVDFRRTRKAATCVSNQGVNVDTVKDYKYLRVHIK